MRYHTPVLLNESVDGLNICESGSYADLTFGGGGHSKNILDKLNNKGKLMVFDQDEEAFANLPDDNRVIAVKSNFRFMQNFMRYYEFEKFDGIIADLGISSRQIDEKKRGFSFRFDSFLDMRMNNKAEMRAYDVINTYDKKDLYRIFKEYGEIKGPGKLTEVIINKRKYNKIETTGNLIEIIKPMTKRNQENKYFSKVFQALRIEVNDELGSLKKMLLQVPLCLRPGGRFVVLSYHSLEDRLVKNFMKSGNINGEIKKDFFGNPLSPFHQIFKKPLMADEEEKVKNPRARSVRLRIAELKKQ